MTCETQDLTLLAGVCHDWSGMVGTVIGELREGRRRRVCIEWECEPENRRVWFDVESAAQFVTRVII